LLLRAMSAKQVEHNWLEPLPRLTPDAVVGTDGEYLVRYMNNAAQAMFGYALDEAAYHPVTMLAPPATRDFLVEALDKAVHGLSTVQAPTVLMHRDGTSLAVLLTVTPVRDARRTPVGAVMLARDVTASRAMQAELHDARARNAALQEQLKHFSRLVALEQAAATVAHELNQPLAAIANYARAGHRLLLGRSGPGLGPDPQPDLGPDPQPDLGPGLGQVAQALERTLAQAQRASEIIARLRAFIANGETDKRVGVLPTLIEDAVALSQPDIGRVGASLHLHLDPRARLVIADRVQLQQVLQNLIRNAAQAMQDSPHRHLTITSRQDDGRVEISVTDTGSGIPAAVRDRLFEPFVTTRADGTGLGLMICQVIVQAHGGTIGWSDAPGGGTTFRLTIAGISEASS
jgi:two-component system sensor kinase FixL